jgi:stearoyl-CoA desaturase (delta-9 desaturase)
MGEGYHNFHHAFPADYRNGVRAHQFDPTKWALCALAALGVARNLRRTPQPTIMRARLRMDEQRLAATAVPAATQERLKQLRAAIDQALTHWYAVASRYEQKRNAAGLARDALANLRADIQAAGRDLQLAYRRWKQTLRSSRLAPLSA